VYTRSDDASGTGDQWAERSLGTAVELRYSRYGGRAPHH